MWKFLLGGAISIGLIIGAYFAGVKSGHKDLEAYKAAILAQAATDNAKAVDRVRAEDKITVARAEAYWRGRVQIVTKYQTIRQQVVRYVTPNDDARGCINNGFVRLWDAASSGQDPATLPGTAGSPDGACDPDVVLSRVEALHEQDAFQYTSVAEQLTELQGWVRDQIAASKLQASSAPPPP